MESAKECVTTHLPNQSALKMDGTRARGLYSTMNHNLNVMLACILLLAAYLACIWFVIELLTSLALRWLRVLKLLIHE